MDKNKIIENLNALFSSRSEFYEAFDKAIPKIQNTDVFDFKKAEKLDAKAIYECFYHYDYAIRKLLPLIYKLGEINPDKDLNKDF